MENYVIGLIGLGVLLILFVLKVPIGFSLLAVGVTGFCIVVTPKAGLSLLGADLFNQFIDYNITVFPMFIFAGSLAFAAGLGDRIFKAAHTLLQRLPGNLAVAAAVACAGFAAICGSSTATAAAVGKVAIPVMKKYNYDMSLATGVVASAGTLGPLIPPSVVFILYGMLTQESIGKLFIAGILPGILLTILMAGTVVFMCVRNPKLAPPSPPATHQDKIQGLLGLGEALILFGAVLGGMFMGWFSPTQGGAALAAAVLILGLIRRQITWRSFWAAVTESVQLSCMIIVIIAGAIVLSRFVAVTHLQILMSNWVTTTSLPPLAVMCIILFGYIILGTFMDMMGMVVLTIPIIFPAIVALGYDPIWFGVMIVIIGGMAVISPPDGINVYVVHSIAKDVPINTIFKGVWPFLGAMLVCVIILMIFPQIATWLPSFMTY